MAITADSPHPLLPALPGELARLAEGVTLPDPMDAPALRWGIIGAGGIAKTFAHDVPAHTRSRIVAVAARDLDRATRFSRELGVGRAYGRYEELVADPDVDAVYVSTIHPLHAQHALLALHAGKPVLVEKSFTMNAAQAREVVDAARLAGLFVMEAMWSRHLPHYRVIRSIIKNGGLGRVVSAQADHGQSLRHIARLVQPELGGGALLDLGIYPVSFLHDVLGAPASVTAVGRPIDGDFGISKSSRPVRIDQGIAAVLRSSPANDATGRGGVGPGGALGVARCNLDGRSATSAEIVFEHGALELPTQFYRPGVLRLRSFPASGPADGSTVDWDATVPAGFQYEAAEVARCLAAEATQSADMTWQDTVEVMEILDAIRAQVGIVYPWE
ncbi:Gfo/Idh/MocA family oxidoreductase [Brooklawnia sp.]|uniref:Gfo/Idh/MocA family protein n=1 Tax=Brooklawnia sp. TaxID=2699740 RepID=UPI003120153E